jgi:uncharacterized protein YneF (UPF0154 family)
MTDYNILYLFAGVCFIGGLIVGFLIGEKKK